MEKLLDVLEIKRKLENEVLVIKELSRVHNTEINKLRKELKEICFHPKEYIEKKSYYFSGSYTDVAYTEYWNECTICGEKSPIITKYHNHYG